MSQLKQPNRHATSNRPGHTAIPRLQLRIQGGLLLIAGLVFLIYWPSINGGFLLDDDLLLTDNALVKAPDGLYRIWFTDQPVDYWPMTNSSFWLQWRLWAMDPTGYHVTNLLLHIIDSILIWLLLRRLAIPGAYFVALLFAVHPVNVESVAWISQYKNLLSLLFFLLSLLWYVKSQKSVDTTIEKPALRPSESKFRPRSKWNLWYFFSLLAFVLAMLSKGSVAVLPLVLLLVIWWQNGRINSNDVWLTVPYFAVAILLTAVNIWFQTHGLEIAIRTVTFAQRLAGAGAVIWFYLFKTLLPLNLAFVYPQWNIDANNLLWWLPLTAVLAATVILWRSSSSTNTKWSRNLWFAWCCFCVALLPVLGFIDVGYMKHSLVANHYLYIAMIPVLALVVAAGRNQYAAASPVLCSAIAGGAIILIGVLSWLSWNQTHLYASSIKLYEAALQSNPKSWLVHTNLSIELNNKDRVLEAVAHAEEALRLKPDYYEAHCALGAALVKLGKIDEAIDQYRQAVVIEPNLAEAYCNLGAAFGVKGQITQAVEYLNHAVQLKPHFFDAQYNLGRVLTRAGHYHEALGHYDEALLLNPNSSRAYADIAMVYADLNRPAQAIATVQIAIVLARSSGDTQLAGQLESWLTSYRAHQASPPPQIH